ncbi:uncharacterized protein LOC117640057 isoform X2 [Thrips palmi]|uniref:Uncharacterized protein LOC117640057 isoform X2 n=1 Tax=Thrips palmi TaxID=161013 RepID=A0A6P8ZHN6_THRPL|nr:uncharacterized protein LOC117640057 isoform X2 [Thrips palmi]
MDRPHGQTQSQSRQAAPYRLQVSRPLLHAYTISDIADGNEPVVGYALPVTKGAKPQPSLLGLGQTMAASAATRTPTSSPNPNAPNNNKNKFGAAERAEPEEDIAAIAKQISDHAEAIYQTWKSRGLAPAEILNMPQSVQSSQAMEQLVNKFVVEDKARQAAQRLSPGLGQPASPTPRAVEKLVNSFVAEDKAARLRQTSPGLDLGLDDNNKVASSRRSPVPSPAIEQLVNNFVSEDKARLAAQQQQQHQQRGGKSLPSSIQFALQKFENKQTSSPTAATTPLDGRTSPTPKPSATSPGLAPAQPTRISPNKTVSQQPPLHHQEIFLETIETSFPEDLKPQRGSPVDAVDGSPAWPLKHKQRPSVARASEYLDEVAREEERLINALKTGIILAEDSKQNKKAASPTASPVKKKDKPAVDLASKPTMNGVRHPSPSAANKVPHPAARPRQTSTPSGYNQANGHSPNPVRPFLTRGSVAERVLIFEKCPSDLLLDSKRRPAPAWRAPQGDVQARAQTYSRDKDGARPGPLPGTLQRQARASRNHLIPRFYYPQGKPILAQHLDLVLKKVAAVFDNFPNQQVPRHQFGVVTKACDCPLYWKVPLFMACGGDKAGYVDVNSFLDYWRNLCSSCHNPASRFLSILTRGQRDYLLPEDFIPLVQDVVETHPGLTFLKEATEFHSRYVHTVIARIYYCVNRSWSGRISLAELRRSNLLAVMKLLEEEDDINAITQYFSYEHFYVIYCKFWELDRDHDLFIDRHDLARHSDHALSSRLIERIFSGAVTRGGRHKLREDRMSYTEFVWFLLSEEDKTHPTAVEYWFRCMDLDGDGFLSMYELEYFYEEQLQRMDAIGIETLPFEDCLCQMLDMIRPDIQGKVSLSDLKRCKMTSIFFDTFFNLEKYLDHEQRDPFASQRDHDNEGRELSDWDRYAAEEYELLVAEEGGQDAQEDLRLEDEM